MGLPTAVPSFPVITPRGYSSYLSQASNPNIYLQNPLAGQPKATSERT